MGVGANDDLQDLVAAAVTPQPPGIALPAAIDEIKLVDAGYGRLDSGLWNTWI